MFDPDDFDDILDFFDVTDGDEQRMQECLGEIYDELRNLGPERAMDEHDPIESLEDYRRLLEACREMLENGITGGSRPMPGFRYEDGEIVEVNARTGEELNRYEAPDGPDGEPMKPFESHPVRLLRDIGPFNEGYETTVEMTPNGEICVHSPDGVICTDARPGREFEFIGPGASEPDGADQSETAPPHHELGPSPNAAPERDDLPFGGDDRERDERMLRRALAILGTLSVAGIGTVAYLVYSASNGR